ncbi:hypothetical protein HMPREF0262_03557 [Clostridium sp. ATCC 29733]|nr:hypothetical protein HMPREF0262_03557 [Clostridium sp. ATCC 29733]
MEQMTVARAQQDLPLWIVDLEEFPARFGRGTPPRGGGAPGAVKTGSLSGSTEKPAGE